MSKQSPIPSNIRNRSPWRVQVSELLDKFRASKETFAVVINEYALVIGVKPMGQ